MGETVSQSNRRDMNHRSYIIHDAFTRKIEFGISILTLAKEALLLKIFKRKYYQKSNLFQTLPLQ